MVVLPAVLPDLPKIVRLRITAVIMPDIPKERKTEGQMVTTKVIIKERRKVMTPVMLPALLTVKSKIK